MDKNAISEQLQPLGKDTKVLVQPDDGVLPLLEIIGNAERSIWIKQFTFTHQALLDAIIAAHITGREVRVMLNPHRSSGDRVNDAAYAALEAAGVGLRWANPRFAVTHEKSMLIDDRLAMIATFNFCEKYFTHTRDYGIITERPADVTEIRNCFEADWGRQSFHPASGTALLWSNNNSRSGMSAFIDAARHSLDIQHPKFVDTTILERIVQAIRRGVNVRVLCGGKHGISEWDVLDTFASLRVMSQLGIKVRKQKNLRLHAKLLIADEHSALIGSMNIDRSAFDLRRELGAVVMSKAAIHRLTSTFEADWHTAHNYEAPDPLVSHAHVEDDFPHDPDLVHE